MRFTDIIVRIMSFLDKWLGWDKAIESPVSPVNSKTPKTTTPAQSPVKQANKAHETYMWDTQPHACHSIRLICDEEGLTLDEKNTICACIYQESRFKNSAVCKNRDKKGNLLSSDWGIVQVNDYWHIGKNKDFPNVPYVLDHPEEAVRWMIRMYKGGNLKMWVSYSSGAYQAWLMPSSPMWEIVQKSKIL